MSYILDALNKSEQEHKPRQAPGLDVIHAARTEPGSNLKWIALIAILVAINIGGFLWYQSKEVTPTAIAPAIPPVEDSVQRVVTPPPELIEPKPRAVRSEPIPVQNNPEPIAPSRISALPTSIQRQIPDMRFSSHIYADDPGLRMVNINGKGLGEGDTVANGISISEITEEGVILSYRHYLIEMSVIRDWSFD